MITTKMSAKKTKGGVIMINRKVHKKTRKNGKYPKIVYISGIGTPTGKIAGLEERELSGRSGRRGLWMIFLVCGGGRKMSFCSLSRYAMKMTGGKAEQANRRKSFFVHNFYLFPTEEV